MYTDDLTPPDKQQAEPTFKKTFGFHPLTAWCDNTGESLVIKLRPGRAGSNTAADHIEVLTEATAQIPAPHRRAMLITCDGAGSTHALVSHITTLNTRPDHQVHYSVGFDFDGRIRAVLTTVPTTAWTPALDAAGEPRDDARSPSSPGCCATATAATASPAGRTTCGSSSAAKTPTPARN